MIMSNDNNTKGRIITPGGFGDEFVLREGREIFVVEMPGCRFNKIPVCLVSHVSLNVPIMMNMRSHFEKTWKAIAELRDKGLLPKL